MNAGTDNKEYRQYEPFLNGWKIERKIGQGSIGRVFEITKAAVPEQRAALKVIRLPEDQEEVRRALSSGVSKENLPTYYDKLTQTFVNEYEFMERLKDNDHIVTYGNHMIIPHEDGLGNDILIRMELLHPLIDHALDHEMDEEDVLKLGLDITDALMACEAAGVLHRDIKPDNIFVTEDGEYKLGDFGVARIIEETEMNLSHKGTLVYMAPEVYRGEGYGMPADIYSLGLVMYKYLNNGRLPFMPSYPEEVVYEDNEKALGRRVRKEELPPPENGSPYLKAAVLKACAADVADRYKTAAEFHKALEVIRDGMHSGGRGFTGTLAALQLRMGRKARRRLLIVAAVLILAVAAGAVWAMIPKEIEDISGIESGAEIYIGESLSPEYIIEPDWFKDEMIDFASSDETIFTVNDAGEITAAGVGEADLLLSSGEYKETVSISVVPKVSKIKGVESEIRIIEGETNQLKPVLSPDEFSKEPVSYDSSDPNVAAVTEEGLIVGVSPGTASVDISAGGCTKSVTVTVETKPEPVYYNNTAGTSGSKSGKSKTSKKSNKESSKNGYIDDIDDEYFD
ncbi:MAG: protein kinase [Mogibacterium sp.]|nr:protein kinase [Mogibacterium sp.]